MPRKIVDLSIYLENDVLSDPPPFGPKITYLDHQATFPQMAPFFPGLKKEDLPDGAAWAVEKVEIITHNGTHLDAPYHFHSTMDKALGTKKPAIAIHEVPLEWCFHPGVKLDFRHFGDGYVVTAADVEFHAVHVLVGYPQPGSKTLHCHPFPGAWVTDPRLGVGSQVLQGVVDRGVGAGEVPHFHSPGFTHGDFPFSALISTPGTTRKPLAARRR